MKRFFEWLSETLGGAENAFLDFLCVVAPYAVPIIPAYLTFQHTVEQLGFPVPVAWSAAFVVETLGMASVATAIKFWGYNRKYQRIEKKAPLGLAIGVYVVYVSIVILVNVILEIVAGTRGGAEITSIALFSLLSFPSSVLVAIRAQFREILTERLEEKAARGKPAVKHRPKHASDYKPQIIAALEQEYSSSGRVLTPKEITNGLNLDHDKSKGYVSTLTKQWKSEKGIGGIEF